MTGSGSRLATKGSFAKDNKFFCLNQRRKRLISYGLYDRPRYIVYPDMPVRRLPLMFFFVPIGRATNTHSREIIVAWGDNDRKGWCRDKR